MILIPNDELLQLRKQQTPQKIKFLQDHEIKQSTSSHLIENAWYSQQFKNKKKEFRTLNGESGICSALNLTDIRYSPAFGIL